MPKRPNAKKMASQAWTKMKTLDDAVSSGSYTVGHVTKSLGFCQFLCNVQTPTGNIVEVTALIRGKMKGGKTCPTRVEIGHYLLLDGDSKKTMEVVGVVNRQSELNTLKGSGRVSKALEAVAEDDDDLFDRSEEKDSAEDIWAKKDEEREAEAENLLGRYRRAEAGVRYRATRLEAGNAAVPVDTGFDLWADAEAEVAVEVAEVPAEEVKTEKGSGPARREVTSKRRLAAIAAAEAAERAAEEAEARASWEAMTLALKKEEELEASAAAAKAALASRKVPTSWEDEEVDIDSI
jgi:hypothetical protein